MSEHHVEDVPRPRAYRPIHRKSTACLRQLWRLRRSSNPHLRAWGECLLRRFRKWLVDARVLDYGPSGIDNLLHHRPEYQGSIIDDALGVYEEHLTHLAESIGVPAQLRSYFSSADFINSAMASFSIQADFADPTDTIFPRYPVSLPRGDIEWLRGVYRHFTYTPQQPVQLRDSDMWFQSRKMLDWLQDQQRLMASLYRESSLENHFPEVHDLIRYPYPGSIPDLLAFDQYPRVLPAVMHEVPTATPELSARIALAAYVRTRRGHIGPK
ncbi:hypothetical protein B0T22DRAFT_440720 [Podospora appendiculata]|uniref:Uncharacterized protein n=1 Tax=Podospora appendiculata TaxID=314037 RepID=A0AAE0XAW7_9PEZI|nr:hypothetical protein B0T22DRAFT_440720 [Podospora appendiculata]